MNCTYVVAASAAYNAVFCVTDPRSDDPAQLRLLPPGRIIAPPGTVVNVRHPGPSVGGNTDLQPKLIDLLLRASRRPCRSASPPRSGGSSSQLPVRRRPPGDRPLLHQLPLRWHGHRRHRAQGRQRRARSTRHSNCRNTPVEVFEHRYPLLTLEYGLAPDSGGAGTHRGGLSTTGAPCASRPTRSPSARSSTAARSPPHGPLRRPSGGDGSELLVRRVGDAEFRRFDEVLRRRLADQVHQRRCCARGDELRYRTPGGGGYGDPAERDPERRRARTCARAT